MVSFMHTGMDSVYQKRGASGQNAHLATPPPRSSSDPLTFRFQFDDEGLGVIQAGQETQNVFVGGTNKWSYDAFVNWEFWFPGFPVLVYFKVRGQPLSSPLDDRALVVPGFSILLHAKMGGKSFPESPEIPAAASVCSYF